MLKCVILYCFHLYSLTNTSLMHTFRFVTFYFKSCHMHAFILLQPLYFKWSNKVLIECISSVLSFVACVHVCDLWTLGDVKKFRKASEQPYVWSWKHLFYLNELNVGRARFMSNQQHLMMMSFDASAKIWLCTVIFKKQSVVTCFLRCGKCNTKVNYRNIL